LLLLSLPAIGFFLVVPVRPKRALITYSVDYLLEIVFFALIFLQLSNPCFWGFLVSGGTIVKGLWVGILGGLVFGCVGIKLNMAPCIHEGVISGANKRWRLVVLIRSMVGGGLLFFVLFWQQNVVCQMLGVQEKEQCISALGGILIGYFLGLLILEGLWIVFWELRNHRKLYIDGIEMSNKHWVRGSKI